MGDYQHESPDADGYDICVRCGEPFGGETATLELNHTYGPVIHADTGTEYDIVMDSPPGRPLAHPECYKELEAERNAEKNHGLGEFA